VLQQPFVQTTLEVSLVNATLDTLEMV